MGQLTQIAVIKMLLDSCAAVCVGPTMALTHENLMLEKSKCRIITADGSIVNVDGTLGRLSTVLIHLVTYFTI